MDAVKVALASAALLLVAAKRLPPPVSAPSAPAAATAPSIKQGVELWRAGDYPAAVAMWQPFANAGDPDAMFNIGQAYKLGRGVPMDAAVARDWYRKAAVKGHLPAQANLGIALFQAGEKPESIKWLRTAADRGEARAQYVLGIAAFNGDGLPRSQSLGYAYLLRAQASGLPQAVTALASITPGLSPADRTAGEAVAASLAAGAGVPPALAAATGPRMIAPIRTPPTAAEIAAMRAVPGPAPVATPPRSGSFTGVPAVATASAAPPSGALSSGTPRTAGTETPRTTTITRTTIPAAIRTTPPEVVAARPIPQPTPAQADAIAASRAANPAIGQVASTGRSLPVASAAVPSAIATTDVPASKPVALAPARTASTDVLAAPPGRTATPPSARVAAVTPARPIQTAALRPFETVDKPVTRKPDGWRVQLGAFSARKLADNAWAGVKETAAPAKPIFATDGPVVKLQVGPYATRDAAKAACAKLTEAGKACFVTNG